VEHDQVVDSELSDHKSSPENKFGLKGAIIARNEALLEGSSSKSAASPAEKITFASYHHEAMPVGLRRFTRLFLIGMPLLLFGGGCHCLYDAYWIFK